jgi:hypothetical protein
MKDYKVSSIQFVVRLKHLNINGICKGKHTRKGDTKIFNIVLLKKHFGMGCLF